VTVFVDRALTKCVNGWWTLGIRAEMLRRLELEVAPDGGPARDAFGLAGRKQAYDSAQVFPGGLVQGGVGADQIANHVPCCQVEGAFGGRAHGQRDRTLRAKTDALRRGFLPRPDSDRLREHVNGDGFVSDFDFAIATEAEQVFQGVLSGVRRKILSCGLVGRK
jgi:hypothetical protein